MTKKKWEGGYCERCNNTGEIDCHCGGDLCICGRLELPCPRCHGNSADPNYDPNYPDDEGSTAGGAT